MGGYPTYPPRDGRQHPDSARGRRLPVDEDPWEASLSPGPENDVQARPAPAPPRRQRPDPWEVSSSARSREEVYWYAEPSGDEQHHGGRDYPRGHGVRPSAETRPQRTQTYPGQGPARRSLPEPDRPARQQELERRSRQQPAGRPWPAEAESETNAAGRVSPLWMSAVVVSMLAGLGIAHIADSRAGLGENPFSDTYLFFVGLIVIFVPAAARILMRKTAGAERLALVILLGIAFYVIKVLASPDGFLLNDEFIHLRNTQNILDTSHLFAYNPLLPTAAYYPGLASIAATLTDLTGLSVFVSGLIVIGVARVLISGCLYFVAEKVTGSSRGASIASLIYATNSMFLFWTAQFAYEDLALPLAAFAVWWITRTRNIQGRLAAQAVTVTVIVAVTVTHHISAFALCGILAMLYIAERVLGYPPQDRRYVGFFALLSGALAAFWFFVVAKPAASYLFGQNFDPALQSAVDAATGHGGRELYGGASSAATAPSWYVYVGFVAILVIMAALLPAAIRAWRILRARGYARTLQRRAPVAVAALISLTFPFTLLPRLTAEGSAISGRTSEFIFTAIGCTLGLLVEDIGRAKRLGTQRSGSPATAGGGFRTLAITLGLSLVFLGQVSIGNSFFSLLPNKSVGFPVTVQPYMISAANWSRQHLGSGQTFAADSTNQLALATTGLENPANVNLIYPMFFTASIDSATVGLIKANHIHYVLLDFNATVEATVQPGGSYYSGLEPDETLHNGPLPKAYYNKFSLYTCSRLVYKSGSIQIYDVSQIANGSCVPKLIHEAPSKASSGKKSTKVKAAS